MNVIYILYAWLRIRIYHWNLTKLVHNRQWIYFFPFFLAWALRWTTIVFMHLYGWVDNLLQIVSNILECIIILFPTFLCLKQMTLFFFLNFLWFWSWIKPLKIWPSISIFHCFDPKSTYIHSKSRYGFLLRWCENITMIKNKLKDIYNFNSQQFNQHFNHTKPISSIFEDYSSKLWSFSSK
jgi:hypothetical protein